MPHSIRLRGPWQLTPLGRAVVDSAGPWMLAAEDLPPPCSAEMPADWGCSLGAEFRGLVRFARAFHRPTGLEASSRVWLVVEDVNCQAAVRLNDELLGVVQLAGSVVGEMFFDVPGQAVVCPARFDITQRLAASNKIAIDVVLPPDSLEMVRGVRQGLAGGLIGLVRLEIE